MTVPAIAGGARTGMVGVARSTRSPAVAAHCARARAGAGAPSRRVPGDE